MQRWLDLEGAVNVRDLGGLPTDSGRETTPGILLRGDNPRDLTHNDIRHLLDEYGLRAVIDLRNYDEAQIAGFGLLDRTPVARHHLPLEPQILHHDAQPSSASSVIAAAARPNSHPQHVLPYYRRYLESTPENIATAIRLLATGVTGSTLIHCAAGKDRTSVLVAIVLTLIGVHEDAIVEDFALSATRAAPLLGRLQSSPAYADALADATPDDIAPQTATMQSFLGILRQEYGTSSQLADRLGVSPATNERLRQRLVR